VLPLQQQLLLALLQLLLVLPGRALQVALEQLSCALPLPPSQLQELVLAIAQRLVLHCLQHLLLLLFLQKPL
jgi:hypothetical protein